MGAGEACLAPTWDANSVGATHASPALEAVKPASQVEGRVQLDGPLGFTEVSQWERGETQVDGGGVQRHCLQ